MVQNVLVKYLSRPTSVTPYRFYRYHVHVHIKALSVVLSVLAYISRQFEYTHIPANISTISRQYIIIPIVKIQ